MTAGGQPMLIPTEIGTGALRRALAHGGDFAEVFAEERHSLTMRLEDGKVENVVSGSDRGASVRLLQESATSFGYTDSLEEQSLLTVAEHVGRAQQGRALAVVPAGDPWLRPRSWVERDPGKMEAADKARLLRIIDTTARELSPEVKQVSAVYAESRQRVWITNSLGILAADDRTRVMLAVTVTAQRGSLIQTGRETLGHHGGIELLSDEAAARIAREAAQRALTMLDSVPAPGGRMAVVLANGFGGVLFHEACGHGLEADYIVKKASVWEGKLGTRVADPMVFAYDDGVSAGLWGSAGCDDEGTPHQCTTLIEAGVLTGYLTDRLRGTSLQLALSGNGRRQDFRHIPYPRMTNTCFGRGEATVDAIIADTPRALFARSLSGGEVNPATGEFVFGVSEGYLIEKGKVGSPVRGATLIGNGPEVLLNIDAIADDLEIKPGTCGKEGQWVPVGSGQPTLRIRSLTVGGTSL